MTASDQESWRRIRAAEQNTSCCWRSCTEDNTESNSQQTVSLLYDVMAWSFGRVRWWICFSCFHVGNAVSSVYVVTDAFVVTTANQCGKVGEVCMKTFEVIALNLRKKSDLSAVWKGFNCFSGSSTKISIFRLNFGFEKLVTDICHHFLTFLLTELSVNNENIITCSFNSSLNVSRSF